MINNIFINFFCIKISSILMNIFFLLIFIEIFLFNFNQIVRSPGIYFERNQKENSLIGTIIPNQGSWITIKLNREGEIYTKIDKMRKRIPIYLLLRALGLSKKKIFYSIQTKEFLKKISKNNIFGTQESLKKVNEIINEKEMTLMWFNNKANIFIKLF